ncbi:MAG: hypothetical protein ABJN36_10860 [Cyclobacteriaceae bacterium]
MKLLLITAVREFEKDIKQILKKAGVRSFSYQQVIGHHDAEGETIDGNWFAGEAAEFDSVLFHAFVADELTDIVFERVKSFNDSLTEQSHIHIAQTDIQKSY